MKKYLRLLLTILMSSLLLSFSPEDTGCFSCHAATITLKPTHPVVTCTSEELKNLRKVWKEEKGPYYNVLARIVKSADNALKQEIKFPPRGGQHNQWYHCKNCEVRLVTKSPTEHQCPKCKKIYSGYPYDDVLFEHTHYRNLNVMYNASWAWTITQDPRYAELAAKILIGYADRYKKYPFHGNTMWNIVYTSYSGGHLFEQTLNEASSLCKQIAPAYDLIYNSPAVDERSRKHIADNLIRPMLKNIGKYNVGKVNWQTWHNAGMLFGGAVIGEPEWVDRAINDSANGFLFQLENSLTDDGMWYEMSWGYHSYALNGLVTLAEGARRLGIDLWNKPKFKKAFILPLSYAMDKKGTLPRFGDSVNSNLAGYSKYFTIAFAAYGDDIFLPFVDKKPTLDSIMLNVKKEPEKEQGATFIKGCVFKESGHAILRTNGGKQLAAAFTFGPYGDYHGHLDKLSFVLYASGHELAVDPGRAASQAYRLPVHSKWYKSTISHNTVLVNGYPQNAAKGKLVFFDAKDDLCAVTALCDKAYRGVSHQRSLIMNKDFLVVFDLLKSRLDKTYYWVYHNIAENISTPLQRKENANKFVFTGSEYFKDTSSYMADKNIKLTFNSKDASTHLILTGSAPLNLSTATGPFRSVEDRVPFCLAAQDGRDIYFAAVVEPVSEKNKPKVQSLSVSDKNGTYLISVVCTNGEKSGYEITEGKISEKP